MASIAEQIIQATFDTLRGGLYPTLSSDIGEKFLHVHADTTRIVAVPRGVPSEYRQPDRPGDANYIDAGRILLLRDFMIHWQFWDLDFGTTEDLLLDTVRTLRNKNHHSITFSNEVWEDQQDDEDGWIKHGTVISIDCVVVFPIYDYVPTRVQLTTSPPIATTVKLPADGSGEIVTINEE